MKLLAALPLILPAVNAVTLCKDFRLKVEAGIYDGAFVRKSPDNPYYVIDTSGSSGEIFELVENILVDSDQVSLIVGNSGEVRGALTDEVPIPGFFFFDNNYDLKLKSGDDFYVCDTDPARWDIFGLGVVNKNWCTKVELVKARLQLNCAPWD
ncbi:hypothetical protein METBISCDRAFT_28799 [Metschnikowia bicuspidata]|uniref:Cell wall protein PhiA n=1 Tax=Metschnikowia bicuspidata TaxID=27322 RepID=A0A4P9Z7Y5_9ASCO|nr:hypothetical protein METBISCDRAFT_28799 [Metschnikowia bicuspidata]